MARQDEVATLPGAGNPHHQIGPFGHGRQLGYVGHTQLLQTFSHQEGHGPLITGRGGAGGGYQFAGERQLFIGGVLQESENLEFRRG